MQHGTRSNAGQESNPNTNPSSNRVAKGLIPAPRARAQLAPASQDLGKNQLPGSAGQTPDSLTAKMMEYRSWWNLPRSKSRKSPSA